LHGRGGGRGVTLSIHDGRSRHSFRSCARGRHASTDPVLAAEVRAVGRRGSQAPAARAAEGLAGRHTWCLAVGPWADRGRARRDYADVRAAGTLGSREFDRAVGDRGGCCLRVRGAPASRRCCPCCPCCPSRPCPCPRRRLAQAQARSLCRARVGTRRPCVCVSQPAWSGRAAVPKGRWRAAAAVFAGGVALVLLGVVTRNMRNAWALVACPGWRARGVRWDTAALRQPWVACPGWRAPDGVLRSVRWRGCTCPARRGYTQHAERLGPGIGRWGCGVA
jgi:hypothetical protein